MGVDEGIPGAGEEGGSGGVAGGATSKDQYRVKKDYLVEKG